MSNQIQLHLPPAIPAYNEINRLPAALDQINAHKTHWSFPLELIIVVEPSEDGTLVYAEKMQKSDPLIRVFTHHERRGKGFAVRSGILKARGEFIFFTDADLSTPLKD
ncbi:MAG: glycosyltransferase, partial [Verrucomicrobia bacterium]|nr:glycosyltransferase [Verrucomicrobiota bacterium]